MRASMSAVEGTSASYAASLGSFDLGQREVLPDLASAAMRASMSELDGMLP